MNRIGLVIIAAIAVLCSGTLYKGALASEQASVAPPSPEMLVRAHSPVIGRQDARVTIVEFFDPSCEACRAFYPVVKEILAYYPQDVRLVIRYAVLHQGSEEAIRILEAARAQNLYGPVLEAVLKAQPQWHDGDMTSAWAAAASAGLDVDAARVTLASPDVTALIQQDMADKSALKVRGTPTFFVNGKPLTDFGPEQLIDMVVTEVETGR